jgi:RNA polymerase sigma factor (sigma-70 family)
LWWKGLDRSWAEEQQDVHTLARGGRSTPMPPSEPADLTASKWFAEEVKPHEAILRAYLSRRFPSLPDHDDLVQETYARLLRARDAGRLTYVKAFLFTAARNVAIDLFRRRRSTAHEPISDSAELPLLEAAPDVPTMLERQQRHELLVEAVAALPERCRAVMMLRHIDGLSYKEISARLGISPETVKVHVVKGVRDCTAYFKARGLLEQAAPPEPAVESGGAR